MADFWIKVEKGTPDKPEVFEIAEILNIDPDAVLGKLVRVWCWLDSNSENGHIKTVTHVLIDRLTGHKGFAEAMVSSGWLTSDGVPNFSRHLGESAKKRAKDAERKRMSREASKECHDKFVTKSVTESGLDKSRVDKTIENKNTVDQQVDICDVIQDEKAKIPYIEIFDLYDTHVKSNCAAKGFFADGFLKNKSRKKHLDARWNENEKHRSLEFWENYFIRCADVKWIREGINGESVCTIDMLVNKTKFYRFVEEFWA